MNTLQKLGYPNNKKLLMIHADDAGLSTSENHATMRVLQSGMVNSYSIMVPCPWFYEMADFALLNPQFDNGIHLTLTSEWKNYKFGPVLPVDEVASLVDKNGYFYKDRDLFRDNALVMEVKNELRAQIEKALDFGLTPSHLDCHMYSIAVNADFLSVYKSLGKEYGLPVLLSKGLMRAIASGAEKTLEDSDFVIDHLYVGEYKDFEKGHLKKYYSDILDNLEPGLSILLIHPSFDTEEMRSITRDHPNFGSQWRQVDFDFFTSGECREKLEKNNIELISWTEINNRLTNHP